MSIVFPTLPLDFQNFLSFSCFQGGTPSPFNLCSVNLTLFDVRHENSPTSMVFYVHPKSSQFNAVYNPNITWDLCILNRSPHENHHVWSGIFLKEAGGALESRGTKPNGEEFPRSRSNRHGRRICKNLICPLHILATNIKLILRLQT